MADIGVVALDPMWREICSIAKRLALLRQLRAYEKRSQRWGALPKYLFKLVYDQGKNRGWARWHLNDNATRASRPISYSELVRRTGIDFLPGQRVRSTLIRPGSCRDPIRSGLGLGQFDDGLHPAIVFGCCGEAPHDHVFTFDRVTEQATDILGEGAQTDEKLHPCTVAYAVNKCLNNAGKWRQP